MGQVLKREKEAESEALSQRVLDLQNLQQVKCIDKPPNVTDPDLAQP
jgi:hypothetical protein